MSGWRRLARPLERLLLIVAVGAALASRGAALGTYGFSEDETAKLRAIDAYRRGELFANAEHPMLLKLAIWGSLDMAEHWNGLAPAALHVPPEAALRIPNVLAGAATVAAVFGLAGLLFGSLAGAIAAFIVALDPNVTALNRIGKEETLLMLFFVLAMYLYERAKLVGAEDPRRAQRWYYAGGVSFGLMLASKYAPHVFGFYATYNVAADRRPGANRPKPLPYNGLIVAAFLALNFAILLPDTWAYCLAYLQGGHSTHHGHLYDGELYANSAATLLSGVPPAYYLHLLVTKTPLVVLAAAAVGLIPLVTRRRERGFVWLRVLLVLPLLAYSVSGAKFQRYALQMLLVNDILAAVGLAALLGWVWRRSWPGNVRAGLCVLVCAGMAGTLAGEQWRAAPFYSIYQNELAERLAPPATTFPEEAYDYGVREAVSAIAVAAAPGAAVVSDAAMVVEHYLRRAGRRDLDVRSLSGQGLRMHGEQWVLVQDSHLYFENAPVVSQLRRGEAPWREYRLGGTPVLQVFRVDW